MIVGEPHARADTPQVTVGGPFTLTAPDGTTVTDATYRSKWLLVFFGYTFCPDTRPTTLMKIAAHSGGSAPTPQDCNRSSSPSILSATHPT
ncbi:MAG TPA: hypothetical protein DCL72_11555 [Rhizobiales bacterium]|nr:hypothetical protein [Hyphomicrobiales bacterium]HBR26182.1 hypothetical protein [Hyphomicrobiales bacterium]